MSSPTPPESLTGIFARLIENSGSISVQHFMTEANARYYSSRDPLGKAGDFITAPEISQMFGELIGLWLADMWISAGRPTPVHYVELGPGRGTLARDALRSARRYGLEPSVHFLESSIALKALQLADHPNAIWHDTLGTIPADGALLIVANEFFDALAVRQLVKVPEGWRERRVDLRGGMLLPVVGDAPMDAAVPVARRHAPTGSIFESCPAAEAVTYELAGRLITQGGAALLIDYGHTEPHFGSTLQAVRDHRKVDPFVDPGEADLSAHVDFHSLAMIAQSRGANWLGTVEQGSWLRSLGIETRAAQLKQAAPQHADAIESAMQRLIAEGQMGALFKVMGLAAPSWPAGAGF